MRCGESIFQVLRMFVVLIVRFKDVSHGSTVVDAVLVDKSVVAIAVVTAWGAGMLHVLDAITLGLPAVRKLHPTVTSSVVIVGSQQLHSNRIDDFNRQV